MTSVSTYYIHFDADRSICCILCMFVCSSAWSLMLIWMTRLTPKVNTGTIIVFTTKYPLLEFKSLMKKCFRYQFNGKWSKFDQMIKIIWNIVATEVIIAVILFLTAAILDFSHFYQISWTYTSIINYNMLFSSKYTFLWCFISIQFHFDFKC